jgi:hypothetical protein
MAGMGTEHSFADEGSGPSVALVPQRRQWPDCVEELLVRRRQAIFGGPLPPTPMTIVDCESIHEVDFSTDQHPSRKKRVFQHNRRSAAATLSTGAP